MKKIAKKSVLIISLIPMLFVVSCNDNNQAVAPVTQEVNENVIEEVPLNDERKIITYEPTEIKTLSDSNIVYEYVYENTGKGSVSPQEYDKHIVHYRLYYNDNIGIHQTDEYTYSTETFFSQITEINYDTGIETVLREGETSHTEKNAFSSYIGSIAFDNEIAIYSYYDDVSENIIKSVNVNTKEENIIKTVPSTTYIAEIQKLNNDNIVVMYANPVNTGLRYTFEIINVRTRECKVVYTTSFYRTKSTVEEYTTIGNGNAISAFCIDNNQIVMFNSYYEDDIITERKIIIVDADGNIVEEYKVNPIDNLEWKEINESYDLDDKDVYVPRYISKINDYISWCSVGSGTTVMYKIVDDELVELKMPDDFYRILGVSQIDQMKLEKRYFMWLQPKHKYDAETNQPQIVIVFDTETGKLHRVEVFCEGVLEYAKLYNMQLDYNDKMLIHFSNEFIDPNVEYKNWEVIVDLNQIEF